MEEYTKELMRLTEQSQELQRQIDATGLLKLKQGVDEAIVNLKEKMKDAVENKTLKTGKRTFNLENGDVITIEAKRGRTDITVEDVSQIAEEYIEGELVEDAGVLPDGTMYQLLNPVYCYAINGQVYKKEVNLELIKNLVRAGKVIGGVTVKKARPSIIIGVNGKTLK